MIAGQQRTGLSFISTKGLVTTFALSFFFGSLISVSNVSGAELDSLSGELQLSVEDGRLSLEAEDVPLHSLLQTLGDQAGFKLELRGDRETLVSPSIMTLG